MFHTFMPFHGPAAWRSLVIALITLASLAGCSTQPKYRNAPADIAALQQVVEVFRTSILKKDKAAFMALFFSDQPELVTWQAVVDDASLALIQKERPQAIKARYRPSNHYVAFIDSIVNSTVVEEERFSNVRIDTDGEIASVSFDYAYLSGGQLSNSGLEKWLLVRTEQGWKITSVVYTIRLPQVTGGVPAG